MKDKITISVFEIVGNGFCVASEDGQKIFDQVKTAFKAAQNVDISFKNVTSLTSAFLNTSIGQLYSSFDEAFVREHLSVSDLETDDLFLLKRVVETAKEYFKNPARIDKVLKEENLE